MAQNATTMNRGSPVAQSPTLETTDTEDSAEVPRVMRVRAETLDRACARLGFVRSHRIDVGPEGITGHIRAPARLFRQSLAPVIRARNLCCTTQKSDPRPEEVVTFRLSNTGGE